MGKQLINQVQCQHCGKMFDVNTEDIEWEHVADLGENEEHAPLHDYGLIQNIECSHCGGKNSIVYKALGTLSTGSLVDQRVMTI